jgi:hypothetical protein
MSDGIRAMVIKSHIHTFCDGCHYHKKGNCGSPLVQVNCPISLCLELYQLYEQEKKARKEAERKEWSRGPRDDR